MRYASYVGTVGSTWGAEVDGTLYDLGPSGLNVAASLKEAIVEGRLTSAPGIDGAPAQSVADTVFETLIADPGKVVCAGVNYKTHQTETGRADVPYPTIFIRWADTLAPAGVDLKLPAESENYDYEGEVALVISRAADHVSREDAYDYVAGYALFNDLSARDWQRHTGQWSPGKNFPESGAFGPYFVPSADIDDLEGMVLETRINGEVRQHATLADLLFDIPTLIEYTTSFTKLAAGDVIVTGTPGGVGLFMDPPTFLARGDVMEIEATGLGVLENTLV
jgi:2-keto-4-pentenoate hydratase/2-oxohepta-3-ene-1,7-dioic acid hydratase in catechol pathway